MVGAQRPHGIPDAVSFHFDRDALAVLEAVRGISRLLLDSLDHVPA